MLLLLLARTSRCEPCKSLLGSLATTPLVDFHHRRTACPSYKKEPCDYCNHKVLLVRHKGPDRLLRFACRLPPRLPSRSPSDHSLFECSQDIRITLMPSRVRIPFCFRKKQTDIHLFLSGSPKSVCFLGRGQRNEVFIINFAEINSNTEFLSTYRRGDHWSPQTVDKVAKPCRA